MPVNPAERHSSRHPVSAWAAAPQLVLGPQAVDAKSNAITAQPQLPEILTLPGKAATAAAPRCAASVKQRRKAARAHCGTTCGSGGVSRRRRPKMLAQISKGHGRIETRIAADAAMPPGAQKRITGRAVGSGQSGCHPAAGRGCERTKPLLLIDERLSKLCHTWRHEQ